MPVKHVQIKMICWKTLRCLWCCIFPEFCSYHCLVVLSRVRKLIVLISLLLLCQIKLPDFLLSYVKCRWWNSGVWSWHRTILGSIWRLCSTCEKAFSCWWFSFCKDSKKTFLVGILIILHVLQLWSMNVTPTRGNLQCFLTSHEPGCSKELEIEIWVLKMAVIP
jgi:hypothetical protein